jgi:hypothetical protein
MRCPHCLTHVFWFAAIAGSLCAQSLQEKPAKAFWPREVQITEGIVLEQTNRYGLISSKRLPGAIVKVINLDSDFLKVESEGFSGKIAVEKTDFWQRAESARKVSKERENRERKLAVARQQKDNEERIKAARVQRYESAADIQLEIVQVTEGGCLAIVLDNGNLTRKRIFIQLRGSVAEGQRYEVRAEQSGTFSYKTVLGAPATVERWTLVPKPE